MTSSRTVAGKPQHARSAADAALDPVRAALIGSARDDADHVVSAARRDAAAILQVARERAADLLAAATAAGKADANARAARAEASARRKQRAAELAVRAAAYHKLRAEVRAAVRDLPRRYPDLRARLAARARAELGPGAVLTAMADGGVLAELDGRRLDLSLDALADLAVDDLGAELELLWQP